MLKFSSHENESSPKDPLYGKTCMSEVQGFYCEGRPSKAVHSLDPSRSWFLLYDTVHLLKSLRNNWITEGSNKVTFDGETFADI